MKCTKCGEKWTAPSGKSFKFCPNCANPMPMSAVNSSDNECKKPLKLTVGGLFKFGGYDWRVLEVQGGKALLLSENVLEKREYHKDYVDITWENSTLCSYLNNQFYNKFSNEEKTLIAETRVINTKNLWYGTKGGNYTTDKIFLLSIEEVVKYFGDSGDLKNRKGWYFEGGKDVLKDGKGYYINDQYNNARIAKDVAGEACWFWLRSPGYNSTNAAPVYNDGTVTVNGFYVLNESGGVRPALWVNL